MSILDQIKAYKLAEVAEAIAAKPLAAMELEASQADAPRPFAERLYTDAREGYALIAEIKQASPSKGIIRADFDPVALAKAYQSGGATCLSILTDRPSFQGSDEALIAARAATNLPVLRKDFMFEPYQIFQSRAMGADCILLIMAALETIRARELEDIAMSLGMSVLIEVHNAEELEAAGSLQSPLIGINNRDLHSFETTLETTKTLARIVPEGRQIISESGLHTPDDLAELARYGARSFLIGESLMRADDVEAATRALLARPLSHAGGL